MREKYGVVTYDDLRRKSNEKQAGSREPYCPTCGSPVPNEISGICPVHGSKGFEKKLATPPKPSKTAK